MGSNPQDKINAHSTEELQKMSTDELIAEAQRALEASDRSFDWCQNERTAVFFGKQKRDDQTEQSMHEAYEAGDYAGRYYRILRDVFLQKQGFPLENDKIADISDPCIRIFAY